MKHLRRNGAANGRSVCIGIEHPVRELEQSVLIKLALAELGIDCSVASAIHNLHIRLRKRRDAVISPWGHGDHEYEYVFGYAERLYPEFLRVVFWQEQILSVQNEPRLMPKGRSLTDVDLHLTWGRRHARLLAAAGVPRDKIYITGSPRIDVLHERFRANYMSRSALAREIDADPDTLWVFTPCSFKLIFLLPSIVERKKAHGFDNLHLHIEYTKAVYSKWAKIVRETAEALGKNVTIIVRPHPSEPEVPYLEEFADLTNVAVCKKHPVSWWLKNSDFVLTTKSTSSLEAVILGARVALIEFPPMLDDAEPDTFDFLRYFPKVNDAAGFCDLIHRFRDATLSEFHGQSYGPLREYLIDAFGFLDGRAHQRVALLLNEMLSHRDQEQRNGGGHGRLSGLGEVIKDWGKGFILARREMGRLLAPQYYANRRTDYLSRRAVEGALQRYREPAVQMAGEVNGVTFERYPEGTAVDLTLAGR